MSTAMPSGDSSLTGDTTRSEVDPETAPATGLEPDTAADAAGAQETTPSDENAVQPAPDEENAAGVTDGSGADADDAASTSSSDPAVTELDGPALENPEMRRATEDLQSSEEKTAQARDFSDDLVRQSGVDER